MTLAGLSGEGHVASRKRFPIPLLIAFATATVLGCGPDLSPEEENQIEFLIDNLAIQKGRPWLLACRRLITEYGDRATPQLIENLGSFDPGVRRGCAYCLGHIEASEAIDPLRSRLGDPDLFVRLEAAAALLMMGKTDGVPLLLVALEHEKSALIRSAAIQALSSHFEQDLGYLPKDPVERRILAVERWRRWWRDRRKPSRSRQEELDIP